MVQENAHPVKEKVKKKRPSFSATIKTVRLTIGILLAGITAAILTGLPIAIIETTIRFIIDNSSAWLLGGHSTAQAIYSFTIGMRVGFAVILILSTWLLLPFLWRITSSPRMLRLIAYVSIQVWALSAGLALPTNDTGGWATWYLAGCGTVAWWVWQSRWRGAGVAPSPIAGLLRPELHSGQIWYAVVTGARDTKVRPVIILGAAEDNKWMIAYSTSQEPREHLAQHYIAVPHGGLRGLPKENWVSLRDPRPLSRRQFRTYTGLAPEWLYKEICKKVNFTADPHAFTIKELKADERPGLIERLVGRVLSLGNRDPELDHALSSNLKALFLIDVTPKKEQLHSPAVKQNQPTTDPTSKPNV